jgi:predicted enzyme related to lactoylglutathione lyase
MKVKDIGFIGIPVTDIDRARKFYEGVLGLTMSEKMMGGQWVEYGVGSGTLAIANVGERWKPSDDGTSVALEMEEFDQTIAELKRANIKFAAEPFETPCCHMAVVHDPDGNKIIIHKLKPEDQKGICA